MLKGYGVSRGLIMGKALVYENKPLLLSGETISPNQVEAEKQKFTDAVQASSDQIQHILDNLDPNKTDPTVIELMNVHIELTQDPMLTSQVIENIESSMHTASDALILTVDQLVGMFEAMDDEYLAGRAADIKDIGMRIGCNLLGITRSDLSALDCDYLIVAEDVTPSETVTMDQEHVLGFITQKGSKTSHTAILANILEIPAAVNIDISSIRTGDTLILDGEAGEVYVNPDAATIEKYEMKRQAFLQNKERLATLHDLPAATKDGHRVELALNIQEPAETAKIDDYGADGVGLFRTEFLYMNRSQWPDEETQFLAYKETAELSKGKPVIIRTLDIGGDKELSYLEIEKEDNPFLGYRAIRLCLGNPELFKVQLRAILRASAFGNLQIMFPMISAKRELLEAKKLLEICKQELQNQNIAFDDGIKVGIMVEIPTVAAAAECFANDVDFFSIGTNDLCQYSLAVDRMNPKIADLYNHFDPGVLRLIKNTIEAGHQAGVPTGMCGEMASDPNAAILLAGMGLDEFSVSPSAVPYIKDVIRRISLADARQVVQDVLKMDSAQDIQEFLTEKTKAL